MDESVQKQIEQSLIEQPEWWVWRYTSGELCSLCCRTPRQSLRDCIEGHETKMPQYFGAAELFQPHARVTTEGK